MSFCNACGGYPHECDCATDNVVSSYTPTGLPVREDGTIITSLLTRAQVREIERRAIDAMPVPQLMRRQAGRASPYLLVALVLCVVVLLAGCEQQAITEKRALQAITDCASHGGLKDIDKPFYASGDGSVKALCIDGTEVLTVTRNQ